ncbi:MAG: Coenzyme F420 hydrogenase/dehydrogenase, beta subunit C-terminal domain [Lachnospiraceae bacterium]|nr:Coenzyme F420 hydrogenase/dehydrogenase, beta subunit C-terminal domain [Candidatus Merdinaster equi]
MGSDLITGDRNADYLSISAVPEKGLCCSCGICAGICPVGAVSFERRGAGFIPVVDNDKCIKCGKCLKACPGAGYKHGVEENEPGMAEFPPMCYSVQTKNTSLIRSSTSGGFITNAVSKLLRDKEYDVAFLIRGYSYDKQVVSLLIGNNLEMEETEKSRYIPVSHENAVRFIRNNRDKKVIFVGTPCAVHGLLKTLEIEKIPRDNILIIGLFCDMSMNYSMFEYIKHLYGGGKDIENLYFRDKRAGGYPGNMRIEYSDGTFLHISAKERMILKDFCKLERCLYCLDKLNEHADFSVGDNYTGMDNYSGGSSSLILRSKKAEEIWEKIKDEFAYSDAIYDAILTSQKLAGRTIQLRNLDEYACENGGAKPEEGIPRDLAFLMKKEQLDGIGIAQGRSLSLQKGDISLGESGDFAKIDRAKKKKKRRMFIKGIKNRLGIRSK